MLPASLANRNWNSAEETLNQSLFTTLSNVREIDPRVFSKLQEFKIGCNRLRKADVEKGGAVLVGKPLDAKRAEEGVQFYCCVTSIILQRDQQAERPLFPLLSALELLQVFPDFHSVQSDELEMGLLCIFYQVLAASKQALVGKLGVSMKVAAPMESGRVYVMGGGARPETRRRALMFDRVCADKTQGKGYWDPLGSHKSLPTLPATDFNSICSSMSSDESETDEESTVLGKRQRLDDDTTTTWGAKRAQTRPDAPSSVSCGSTDSDSTPSKLEGNSATFMPNEDPWDLDLDGEDITLLMDLLEDNPELP
jgi:hypothetical protein